MEHQPEKIQGGRWAWGRTAGGWRVVKANRGMILRKSVEYIRWVCFLLLREGWMAAGVHSNSGDCPHPHFFPNQLILTPPLYYLDTYLQQLVTAQGAQNCELKQDLTAYQHRSCSSSSMVPPLTDSEGMAGDSMILHDKLHHFHHGQTCSCGFNAFNLPHSILFCDGNLLLILLFHT